MEEITGPIIAITLVLCAVFVPCTFITGITGRFFRQFAVTIAASTIISADQRRHHDALARLLIFKSHPPQASSEGGTGTDHAKHQLVREALPWWIFGFIGGYLTLRLTPVFARLLDLKLPLEDGETALFSLQSALFFAPGFVVGLVLGWFIIHPVNRFLGGLFFGASIEASIMSPLFMLGRSASCLHLSLVVLLIYGILLGVTYWVFLEAPTGFVPQQDMGRLTISVQLPDSSSLERTDPGRGPGRQNHARHSGRGPYPSHQRRFLRAASEQPQLRFALRRPGALFGATISAHEQQEAMKELHMRDLKDESIMKALRRSGKRKSRRRRSAYSALRPFLASASPAASKSRLRTKPASAWRIFRIKPIA